MDRRRATLTFRRFLRHPPATVWKAITDPQELKRWFLTTAQVDGRVGGRVDLVTGPSQVHATGRILAWDPPHLYEYEWNVPPDGTRLFPGERSVVRWELTPQEGGTVVVLTHRGLTKGTADVFRMGLPTFLERLECQLDGRPLPDWESRVNAVRRQLGGPEDPSRPKRNA